jgi:predicted nucleic acid-binding protein
MDEIVVIDTNIISFLIKLKGKKLNKDLNRAKKYLEYLTGRAVLRAFPTDAELMYWLNITEEGKNKELYKQGINEITDQTTVIDSSPLVAAKWAEIVTTGNKMGRIHLHDKNNPNRDTQINDTWIAACALAQNLPLVSDNFKDFDWMQKALGLKLICFSSAATIKSS